MKARDVIGKRVVAIKQQRFYDQRSASWLNHLDWIKFDDGTVLSLLALETDVEPYVCPTIIKLTKP
jgi:hypothetical protein